MPGINSDALSRLVCRRSRATAADRRRKMRSVDILAGGAVIVGGVLLYQAFDHQRWLRMLDALKQQHPKARGPKKEPGPAEAVIET